nr:PAS domain-containing protein [Chloroflexaceae bacterium]
MYNKKPKRPALRRIRPAAGGTAGSTWSHHIPWNQIPDVVFQADAACQWVAVNQAWTTLTGYAIADMLGCSILDSFHADDRARLLASLLPMIENRSKVCRTEARVVTSSGNVSWVEIHAQALRNEHGTFVGVVGTMRDCTERQQSALSMQRSMALLDAIRFAAEKFLYGEQWQQHLASVLARMGQAIQVDRVYLYTYNEDATGTAFIHCRAAWDAPTAPARAGLLAEPVIPVAQTGFAHWDARLQRGELICGPRSSFSAAEAAFLAAQHIFSVVLAPILVEQKLWGFIGFSDCQQERTWPIPTQNALRTAAGIIAATVQREQASLALYTSRQQLSAILSHSPLPIWGKDMDGRYELWANQSSKSSEQVLGKTDYDIFPPNKAHDHRLTDAHVLETNQPITFEEAHTSPQGSRTYQITKFPLRKPDGTPYAVYGISIDITERKQNEEYQRFLAEASPILVSSFDSETILKTLAEIAVPILADICSVHVREPDGELRLVHLAAANPQQGQAVRALRQHYPLPLDSPRSYPLVIREGLSELLPHITDEYVASITQDAEHARLLAQVGYRSAMTVPLNLRNQTIGAIAFRITEPGRYYSPEHLQVAEDLARRAALAV